MSPQELIQVHLLGVPVQLWERASAHHEAIQREFDIIRAGQPPDSVPNRLVELIQRFDARFGDASQPTWNELLEAAERGQPVKDLIFTVPPAAAEAARQLGEMLEEVDSYCRAGEHLVTLATSDELIALRRWFLSEFIEQIESGRPPMPWDQFVLTPSPAPTATAPNPGSERITFTGPLDLATAGALRDEIQRRIGTQELILDLSGVGFVDSIGIGLLVSTHNRLASEGARLRLIAPPRLRSLLEVSGLVEILRPEDPPVRV